MIIHTALFAACSSEETQALNTADTITQIKLIDVEGRTIVLEKKTKRIVDLTGLSGTRILIQLDAAQYIVGMTDAGLDVFDPDNTTYHPAQKAFPSMIESKVTNIGNWKEPNAEKIIALDPDILLVGWGGKESAEKIGQQTGIPAVCIGRMDGHFDYDRYRIMGKLIGKEEKSEEIITYLKNKTTEITHVTDAIPDNKKKRVFFWIVPRAEAALRSNGIYDAIDYAGGINVASTKNGMGLYETSKEQVVAWNPDFIFLQSSHKNKVQESGYNYLTIEQVCNDPVLAATNAVINRQVYYLRGPRSDWDTAVEATEVLYMAKLLYPEKFKTLDVINQGNEIFMVLYGVENLYADMSKNVGLHVW
jgi:iron complex transport system substrate-binding protein